MAPRKNGKPPVKKAAKAPTGATATKKDKSAATVASNGPTVASNTGQTARERRIQARDKNKNQNHSYLQKVKAPKTPKKKPVKPRPKPDQARASVGNLIQGGKVAETAKSASLPPDFEVDETKTTPGKTPADKKISTYGSKKTSMKTIPHPFPTKSKTSPANLPNDPADNQNGNSPAHKPSPKRPRDAAGDDANVDEKRPLKSRKRDEPAGKRSPLVKEPADLNEPPKSVILSTDNRTKQTTPNRQTQVDKKGRAKKRPTPVKTKQTPIAIDKTKATIVDQGPLEVIEEIVLEPNNDSEPVLREQHFNPQNDVLDLNEAPGGQMVNGRFRYLAQQHGARYKEGMRVWGPQAPYGRLGLAANKLNDSKVLWVAPPFWNEQVTELKGVPTVDRWWERMAELHGLQINAKAYTYYRGDVTIGSRRQGDQYARKDAKPAAPAWNAPRGDSQGTPIPSEKAEVDENAKEPNWGGSDPKAAARTGAATKTAGNPGKGEERMSPTRAKKNVNFAEQPAGNAASGNLAMLRDFKPMRHLPINRILNERQNPDKDIDAEPADHARPASSGLEVVTPPLASPKARTRAPEPSRRASSSPVMVGGNWEGWYVENECVAKGGQGQVFIAHRSDSKQPRRCAIKCTRFIGKETIRRAKDVHGHTVYARDGAWPASIGQTAEVKCVDAKLLEACKREVKALAKLKHENICQYLGHSILPEEMLLMMEVMHGNLRELSFHQSFSRWYKVTNLEWELKIGMLWKAWKDVLRGLTYIHGHEIAHLDMKFENILYTVPANRKGHFDEYIFKIADFGGCRKVGDPKKVVTTRYYMAPEQVPLNIITNEPPGATTASDIWSTYVSFYEEFEGSDEWRSRCSHSSHGWPAWGSDAKAHERWFYDLEKKAWYNDCLRRWKMMARCDPAKRMTAKEAYDLTESDANSWTYDFSEDYWPDFVKEATPSYDDEDSEDNADDSAEEQVGE